MSHPAAAHPLIYFAPASVACDAAPSVTAAWAAIRAADAGVRTGQATDDDLGAAWDAFADAEGQAWSDAVAAYEAAVAESEVFDARYNALQDEVTSRAPDWLKTTSPSGRTVLLAQTIGRFEVITRNDRYGPAENPELIEHREEFVAWIAHEADAIDAVHDLALEEEAEGRSAAVGDAELALMRTPALDLDGVILKQRIWGQMIEGVQGGRGLEDPIYTAAMRDSGNPEKSWPTLIHDDCLRLAGFSDAHPTFRPRLWIKALKAAGGMYECLDDELPSTMQVSVSGPVDDPEIKRLMAEIKDPTNLEILKRYLWEGGR